MVTSQYLKSMLFVVLAISALACTASAQSIVTGAVSGTITDPTGAIIAGATATLENVSTGDRATATSTTGGVYSFPLLKPGTYTIMVAHAGFKRASKTVQVLLGQTTPADVQLQLGEASATVEVSGVAPLVQTQDANVNTNFDAREVQNLPNPGADLSYVAQTAPGALMNTSHSKGFGNFNTFGLPATSNLFTFNGNDVNDPYLNVNNSGASNLTLGLNDVQEVAVVNNGYTGEYGRQAGAQIDYTTKSGTNQFHGNVIYNWNGSALNAQDYFLAGTPKAFENNNQWAASLGGPIKKGKAFFFVNTEGIRYVFGTASDVWVPTPAFESYVYSQIPATATAFYQKIFGLYNSTPGISRAVPQADSCGSIDPNAFGGQCLQEFHNSSSNGNREWLLQVRGDYDFSQNDKVFVQANIDHGVQPTYTDAISPLFNIVSHQPQENAQLNYTHVFSPMILNNFVASLFYYNDSFQSANLSAALAAFPGNLGSFDTALTPLGTGSNYYAGYPAAGFPSGRRVTQWQLVDDVSIDRGEHLFKFGVNFRRDDISDMEAGLGTEYPFIASTLQDFATDLADQVSQNFASTVSQPIAYYNLGVYFQDSFRATSKLHVTLSLRADRDSPGVCQSNCSSLPVKPFDQLNHSAAISYNQMMDGARHQILREVEALSFQPRVGIAWSPFGQNTVIRGGAGLFTDLYPGFMLDAWTINFPEVTSFQLFGVGSIDPAGVIGNPSGAALISSCNSIFQTNYASGGTVDSFLNAAPSGCAVPNLNDVSSKLLNPKYLEWNLQIQHSFGRTTIASINYVGNHGYDEYVQYPYLNAFDSAFAPVGGFGGLPFTQPDPRVGFVYNMNNNGISNYNGLTFSLQQTLWKGFSGRINYTYSHTLDDLSNGGNNFAYSNSDSILYQINPRNMSLNYGAADYDVRHSLTASYIWDLPFKSVNRALDLAVGGWKLSGTFFARTGYPLSIVDGNTEFGLSGANGAADSHAQVLAQPLPGTPRTCTNVSASCWTSADFATSTTTFGTVARNSFRGPEYFNTDLSLRKNFQLYEGLQLQIGANAYNVLNHPNFSNPYGNLDFGSAFGTIPSTVTPATSPYGSGAQAAVDARIIQLVGKLTF